jgi:uncharacterized protein with HEPN domain
MPRDARKYLFDIGEALNLISQFVAGKTLDDYLKSALLQSGVERQFEVIDEALGQLAKVDQQLASQITVLERAVAPPSSPSSSAVSAVAAVLCD